MYKISFYETTRGESFTEDFTISLSVRVRAKIARWLKMLEEYGPDLPRPFADIIKGPIRELRIVFGSNEYRFLYFFSRKNIIITHGFIKKTDKVPQNEIERAERLMLDFQLRNK